MALFEGAELSTGTGKDPGSKPLLPSSPLHSRNEKYFIYFVEGKKVEIAPKIEPKILYDPLSRIFHGKNCENGEIYGDGGEKRKMNNIKKLDSFLSFLNVEIRKLI